MSAILRAIGDRLREAGSAWWRCFYSLTLTLLGAAGFAFVPQGIEFLRLTSQPGWNFPLFMASVATWSLAAWYSARLTLGRKFPGHDAIDASDGPFATALRAWLPRLLGVLPGALVAVQFQRLGAPLLAAASAAVTLALALFLVKRRVWFAHFFPPAGDTAAAVAPRFASLERATVLAVAGAIALSFALLFLVWWKPLESTAYLSAPVLLCFALASWILFGDLVLIYAFKQAALPSMAALPVLLFVLSSLSNDNHGVALIAPVAGEAPPLRRAAAARFEAWLEARLASGELREGVAFPVFLVAAEGGGIRAAYWSANVLARLQDDSGGRFGRHLFALSGVSGGSLGSAVFTGLMADAASGALARAPCNRSGAQPFQNCARAVLRRDFLSPTVAYMLYPDMLQRFLPAPIPDADRARAMEAAWRAGWRAATGNDRFGQRFDRLWAGAELPSLLLNATLVDGGNRVIASDLAIDAAFPDAYDAFDPLLDLGRMSLATAVHNSARFSYVSPAGTVSACRSGGHSAPCAPGVQRVPWGRLIDGGYFENSGVETVRDLLVAIRPVLLKWQREKGPNFHIDPQVIVIVNSPGAHAPSGRADPAATRPDTPFLSELLAPPMGLYSTRAARATFAIQANSRDMAAASPGDPVRFFWFGLQSYDTPLGWALADRSFDGMDRLLEAQSAALPFKSLIARLPPR